MSLAYFDGTTMPKISVWAGVGTVSASSLCVRGTGVRGTNIRGVAAGTSLVELPASDIRSITTKQGRDTDTDPAAPGTCAIEFYNTSGNYDHTYTGGTWFGELELGAALEVRMDWAGMTYRRFAGQIVDLSVDAGFQPTATWTATDGLEKLGRIFLPTEVVQFDAQRAGERIGTIADRAGWPTIARALDAGVAVLSPTAFGDFALELMRKTEQSELGFLFVNGAGQLVFYDRYRASTASRSTTVQASFSDTATGSVIEMDSVELSRSRERIYNRAVLTREPRPIDPGIPEEIPPIDSPVEQQADNTGAQADPFGILTYPGTAGQFLATDTQVNGLCELIVARYGTAANRIREVKVAAITQDAWSTLLPLTLLDRISVSRDYGPNTIAAELLIQGMTETITDAPSWDYVFSTSEPPAGVTSPCIRGEGVRGTDNRAL